MAKPDFPLVWDSSMLHTLRECKRKFYLEYMWHFRSKHINIHLHFGKAFASAIEQYRITWLDTNDTEWALYNAVRVALIEYGDAEPPNIGGSAANKSCHNLVAAIHYYFTQAFPIQTDHLQQFYLDNGRPAVELSFNAPLDAERLKHPVTGDPIIITGRADFAGLLGGNVCLLADDKTTSGIGPKWADQWKLRSQFACYTWLAQQFGIPAKGVMVRGIAIKKTDFDHAEYIAYQPDWKLERWRLQAIRDIERAIQCWKEGYWDYDLDTACGNWGGCQFLPVCNSHDPATWLKSDFERRAWNPLTREEMPLSIEDYTDE